MINKKNGKLVQRVKAAPDHLLAENAGLLKTIEEVAGFVPNNFSVNIGGASREKVEAIWEFRTHELYTDRERAALEFAIASASVPNSVDNENFGELRKYFDEEEVIEIMSVIAIFGWYNRWNDSMATVLEEEPLAFAQESLKAGGWNEGNATGNWRE